MSETRSRKKSFSLFRDRDQNHNEPKRNGAQDNHLYLNDELDVDASHTSLKSNTSANRRRSFNIFRSGSTKRNTGDPFMLKSQIAEVQNKIDLDEDDEDSTSNLSFSDRKKSIQSQIKEMKLAKHREAISIKAKIDKIKDMNSKKVIYINKLQQNGDNFVTIDVGLGESSGSSETPLDASYMDASVASKRPLRAIADFVKHRKEEEIVEVNEIIERLIHARKKKASLCKTLNSDLCSRESEIKHFEGIVQAHADAIENLRVEIDHSSIDDSTNIMQVSIEERFLSLSMKLNESQRSETQIAEDIKVMRKSMSSSIHKIKNLDKESEGSTFECGKLGARNVFLRTNSVRIVDEVKTVYISKEDVESTVVQLRTYLGLIAKLESYFMKQITKYSFEEEGMIAIVENVNFFLDLATEFNSLVQDTTVILELLEAVEDVHPELLEQGNVYQLTSDIIKFCLSVEEPVVASLLSMKAMLTLMLGSLSKDDEFFTSLESMRKEIKETIEKDYANDKRRISYSKPKNSLSISDSTRIVLKCKVNQKNMEIANLTEQCQNLSDTIERLRDVCEKNRLK